MADADKVKGKAWGERVYSEKLTSGNLPNLGFKNCPREFLAARAVQGIAEKKIYTVSKGGIKRPNPLPSYQRDFWQGVMDFANAKCIGLSTPPEGETF